MESSSLPSPCSDKIDISYQKKNFIGQQQPPIYQQQPQFFQQQPQCTQMDSEYKNNFNYQNNFQNFNQAFYGQTNYNQQAYVNLSQDPLYNTSNNTQQYQPQYNPCDGQQQQSTILKFLFNLKFFN